MLSLATAHIAFYANSLIRFALPISMPRFKSIIFCQNSPKIKLFFKKMQKFQALGDPPRDPQIQPPIANFWLHTWQLCTVFNHMRFCSFFEQFFLNRSVANFMMLIINICVMLNCFVFEKFYLHYALTGFDSIL